MKAGTGFWRFGVALASVMVTLILAAVVSNAAVTLTTPNSAVLAYTLASGGTSAAITPSTSGGVLLVGTNTTSNNFSVGSISLIHLNGVQIRWVGLESPPSAAITRGATSSPGAHVVYLDYAHLVDVEILGSDQIVVHNRATSTQTGTVKLIW